MAMVRAAAGCMPDGNEVLECDLASRVRGVRKASGESDNKNASSCLASLDFETISADEHPGDVTIELRCNAMYKLASIDQEILRATTSVVEFECLCTISDDTDGYRHWPFSLRCFDISFTY